MDDKQLIALMNAQIKELILVNKATRATVERYERALGEYSDLLIEKQAELIRLRSERSWFCALKNLCRHIYEGVRVAAGRICCRNSLK